MVEWGAVAEAAAVEVVAVQATGFQEDPQPIETMAA